MASSGNDKSVIVKETCSMIKTNIHFDPEKEHGAEKHKTRKSENILGKKIMKIHMSGKCDSGLESPMGNANSVPRLKEGVVWSRPRSRP